MTLDPRKSSAGSAGGMLSPSGHCHAFDIAADEFASGEGCAMVLLKRLPDVCAMVTGTWLWWAAGAPEHRWPHGEHHQSRLGSS